jgi:hypothetical protein
MSRTTEQVKSRNVHMLSGSHEQVKYINVHLVYRPINTLNTEMYPRVLDYDKFTNRLLVVNQSSTAFLFDVTRG